MSDSIIIEELTLRPIGDSPGTRIHTASNNR